MIFCSTLALAVSAPATHAVSASNANTSPTIALNSAGTIITAQPVRATSKINYAWVVNGRAIATTKLTLALPKTRGTRIFFREGVGVKSLNSNLITVGSVAVNGNVSINFVDSSNASIAATLPTTYPVGAKVKYQWVDGPFPISSASAATYSPATGDQGTKVSLQVTYSAKGFASTTLTSQPLDIPVVTRNYNLTWSEDFSTGAGLDPKVWAPQNGDGSAQGNRGWGNNELESYTDPLGSNTGDAFTLRATTAGASQQSCYYGPCQWLSAKYMTQGLLGFKYGHIEARIKGPTGAGSWAAFWLLGSNIDTRPWPGCGEIDITELLGRDPKTTYGTPHGPASGNSYTQAVDGGIDGGYHTYAVDWLPDQITWYLDGKPYGTLNESSVSDPTHQWVFNHEFFLIFNLAMGGNFGGMVDPAVKEATTQLQWIHFSTINGVGEVIQH
jgi:beta-glucanase (GH16 family)